MKTKRIRLDERLFERGMADSMEHARAVIMSGKVFVKGVRADKPGTPISEDAEIELRGGREYVSRGGRKLQSALEFFSVSPSGKVCIDCGASTGGFTDCLLKNGARMVYAIDVGYGQLAWSIRNDSRVVAMERTNIRDVTPKMLDAEPEFATIDVSFISLSLVLPVVRVLLADEPEVLCLIKPQFEAEREKVGEKGVVREAETHIAVLDAFVRHAERAGFCVKGVTNSPIRGPEGNIEFFGSLGTRGRSEEIDSPSIVAEAHLRL